MLIRRLCLSNRIRSLVTPQRGEGVGVRFPNRACLDTDKRQVYKAQRGTQGVKPGQVTETRIKALPSRLTDDPTVTGRQCLMPRKDIHARLSDGKATLRAAMDLMEELKRCH